MSTPPRGSFRSGGLQATLCFLTYTFNCLLNPVTRTLRGLCVLGDLCVKIPTLRDAMPSKTAYRSPRFAGRHSEVKSFRISVYAPVPQVLILNNLQAP